MSKIIFAKYFSHKIFIAKIIWRILSNLVVELKVKIYSGQQCAQARIQVLTIPARDQLIDSSLRRNDKVLSASLLFPEYLWLRSLCLVVKSTLLLSNF